MSLPVVGYAGMTHLGFVSAVAAAARGCSVIAYDPDRKRIELLRRGELQVVEPDLPQLFSRYRSRLTVTDQARDLKACEIVYVAPDIPTDQFGTSNLEPIRTLLALVEEGLEPQTVLVVLSQVPPGFTRSLAPRRGGLFYQVETLIFGRAVERALYPERVIVGCADPKAALPKSLADFLGTFACPILPMLYESAELAKISINMCLVASVTISNTLAELCENIGADWSEIVPALKLDKRIGQYAYLSPGLGIAGGEPGA